MRIDGSFVADAERHGLRYTCKDCGHFLAARSACAHEWPVDQHLLPPMLKNGEGRIVFCKEFELE
ncbi:MAG: hypothetical protein HY698_03125 [Deltaproteobacteria bacterium]|nr:hypothetical protein [Deltaproteobacteria bacterium]